MRLRRHGHTSRYRRSPTYNSWRAMIYRCTYPAHPYYALYGGRGITICDRWQGNGGFVRFLADMGERPAGMTLDREDVDGNYEPGNCRWADLRTQRLNQRTWNRQDMAAAQHVLLAEPPGPREETPVQPDIPF